MFQTGSGTNEAAFEIGYNLPDELGPAEEGGYLFRGFQDAGWTMEPDAEASPPPYLG